MINQINEIRSIQATFSKQCDKENELQRAIQNTRDQIKDMQALTRREKKDFDLLTRERVTIEVKLQEAKWLASTSKLEEGMQRQQLLLSDIDNKEKSLAKIQARMAQKRFDLRDELKTLKLPKLGEYKDKLNRKVEIARQKAAQIEAELEEMIDSNTMKMASINEHKIELKRQYDELEIAETEIHTLQSGKADLQGKLAEIRKRGMKRSPDKRKIIKRLEAKVIASRKENAQLFLQLERIDRKLKSKQHIKYISKLTKISNSEEYRPESCRHMTAYEGRSSSTSSSSDASNFLTSPASSSYSDALDLSVVSRTKRSRKFASKPWTRPKKASDSQTAQRKRPDSKDGAPSPHDHYTALAPYRSPKPQTVSRSTTSVYSRGSDDHSTRMPRDGGRSKHTSSDSGSADRTVISLVVSDDDGDDDDMDDTASALSHYEGRSKINIYSDECSNYNSHSHNNGEKHTKTYSRNSDDTHTHGFSLSDEDEAFKFDDEDDVDERHNMSLVPRKPSSSSSFYKAVSRQHTATNQDLSSTSIESDSSFEDLDLELY